MYISAPPIISLLRPEHVLKVKLALHWQIWQIADSFFTFSHKGIISSILLQPFFSKVPLSADIITILPLLAASSEKVTISSKNCPSSIPITSKSLQNSWISESCLQDIASWVYLSCVEMQSVEYRLSAEYLILRHFLPDISSLFTLRSSSVLLPANIGPMTSSILPRWDSSESYFKYL